METKRKYVVHIKRPIVSKTETVQPVTTKESKRQLHLSWLAKENRKYYNFPIRRGVGDAWCEMVVARGEKPIDRLEQLFLYDIAKNGNGGTTSKAKMCKSCKGTGTVFIQEDGEGKADMCSCCMGFGFVIENGGEENE